MGIFSFIDDVDGSGADVDIWELLLLLLFMRAFKVFVNNKWFVIELNSRIGFLLFAVDGIDDGGGGDEDIMVFRSINKM